MEIACFMLYPLVLLGLRRCQMNCLLTAIELYENADFYGNHPHFDTVLSTMVGSSTTVNNLFTQSLSDAGCKVYTKIKCRSMAVK